MGPKICVQDRPSQSMKEVKGFDVFDMTSL